MTTPSRPDQTREPANLRFLRLLVTVLTVTMIVGLITIVTLFVIRLPGGGDMTLPDRIALPAGMTATAFTQGRDWYAVVTDEDRVLIYDRATGALRQTIEIEN